MGSIKKKTGLYYIVNTVLVALLFVILLVLINTGVINRYNTRF